MDLKIPDYKKEVEILDLQMKLGDHSNVEKDVQIMYQKVMWSILLTLNTRDLLKLFQGN